MSEENFGGKEREARSVQWGLVSLSLTLPFETMKSKSSPEETYSITTKMSVSVSITSYLSMRGKRHWLSRGEKGPRTGSRRAEAGRRETARGGEGGAQRKQKPNTFSRGCWVGWGGVVVTHSRMMCGCTKSFRMLISRRTFSPISKDLILARLRIFIATLCPVSSCSATA